MARPSKIGLDYFELDCHMDSKVKLIQAEFGLKGFAVVVKLLQKIYGENGYYCEWEEDALLLFMSENGLNGDSKKLINEIVSACIRRNIFSEEIFKKFNILTSAGVQKRYLNATSKREKIELKKEYLLVSVGKNYKNVVINSIYDGRNLVNDGINSQSREDKSKEEERRERDLRHDLPGADFEKAWDNTFDLYPKKSAAVMAKQKWLDKLIEVIEPNRADVATLIYRATKMYIVDYENKNPDDRSFRFLPKYADWLEQDCDYWISQYEKEHKEDG